MKNIWVKRGIWGIVGFFGLLLVAAIVIPLVVDVDQYRPQMVDTANRYLNGKLEMGKLSLSLWGRVKVEVDGFELKDAQGRKVVAAKDVFFDMPFLSILSGSPRLTFRLRSPEVQVIKDRAGKMNVMSLVKKVKDEPVKEKPTDGGSTAIPAIVAGASLGMELLDAQLLYRDEGTELDSKTKNLNVVLKDVSLSKEMTMEVWADLDTKMGKTLTVKGPVKLSATAKPELEAGKFKQAKAKLSLIVDDLEILVPEVFHKTKGVPANGDGELMVTTESATLTAFKFVFHNAEIKMSGAVNGMGSEAMSHQFQMTSNSINLAEWGKLAPAVENFGVQGTVMLKASSKGALDNPQYNALMAAKDVSVKTPMVKTRPKIQATVKVIPDAIEEMTVLMQAPATELLMKGSLSGFTTPKFAFNITSKGMDLDQWVEFPKPAPAAKGTAGKTAASAAPGTASGGTAATGTAPASDFDAMLDPLRENAIAKAANGTINVDIRSLKAKNVVMAPIQSKLSLSKLNASVDSFLVRVFKGEVRSTASMNLAPKMPTYKLNAEVKGFDMKSAVESQMELFKNTLTGQANFSMSATGKSFNPDPAIRNLDASGNMKVMNAKFATIDIATVASAAVNNSINQISQKVGGLKGKKVNPGNTESIYESVSSTFTMKDGVFRSPDFKAKAQANRGIDLEGSTTVNAINYSLQADWLIIDTYNMTKARDVSVTEQGVQVNQILAKDGAVRFPIKVGGTLMEPKFDYGAVPAYLAQVAVSNVGNAVAAKVKAEAQKAVQKEVNKVTKKAAQPIQNAIKGFGKKLFGK